MKCGYGMKTKQKNNNSTTWNGRKVRLEDPNGSMVACKITNDIDTKAFYQSPCARARALRPEHSQIFIWDFLSLMFCTRHIYWLRDEWNGADEGRRMEKKANSRYVCYKMYHK